MGRPWIGYDLDGTWARWDAGQDISTIGNPIPEMTKKVRATIEEGLYEARVFTARVSSLHLPEERDEQRKMVQAWTRQVIGKILEVTAEKDMDCVRIVDDRAEQIVLNTGLTVMEFYMRGVAKDLSRAAEAV